MRVVKVYWRDSASRHGWVAQESPVEWAKEDDCWCTSVGFVLAENPTFLILTGSLSEDMVDSPMKIPKFAIKHIETLIEDEPMPDGRPAVLTKKAKRKTPDEE